jgi:hypothetical protein
VKVMIYTIPALLILALCSSAWAGALPETTAVLVRIDDIAGIGASFAKSPARAIYDDVPAVRGAVDGLLGGFGGVLKTGVVGVRKALGFSVGEQDEILALPSLLRGSATLALIPAARSSTLEPLLSFEAKTAREAEALRSALEIVGKALQRASPENGISVEEGVTVLRGPDGEAIIAYAFRGKELLLTQGPHLVRLALESAATAAWDASIEKAIALAGKGSGLRAWVNVGALARLGDKGAFDKGFRDLLRVLEALGVRAISCASRFTPDGGRDAIHLSTSDDSILRRFVRDCGDAPWPEPTPTGTVFSVSIGASPEDLLAAWLEVTETVDEKAFAGAQHGLEQLLLGLGIDAREDILAKMGEGVVLHGLEGRLGMQVLATAPVRDREALLEAGDLIAMHAEWRRTDREDGVMWIDVQQQTGFLLRKDSFCVGSLEAMAALNGKPVAHPALERMRAGLPEHARILLTADHAAILDPIRKALAGARPALARALAPGDKLAKKLGAEAVAVIPTKSGVAVIHTSTAAPAGVWLATAILTSVPGVPK